MFWKKRENMDIISDNVFENEIFLWEKSAPGSEKLALNKKIEERTNNPDQRDRAVTSILKPSIIPMFPENPNGTAVVICPGGGYQKVVIDKEGFEAGRWLNSLGITAFILIYRLPGEGHENRHLVPLQDAQRAVRIVKSNAAKWKLDPHKIGIMGFSAGGHLAAAIATNPSLNSYKPADDIDKIDAKVSFQVLIYPVITMNKSFGHEGSVKNLLGENASENLVNDFSNEILVNNDTSQAFIVHATDDGSVPSENSILFYMALKKHKISSELHIFKNAGHGFGLRKVDMPVGVWPELCEEWLKSIKMI